MKIGLTNLFFKSKIFENIVQFTVGQSWDGKENVTNPAKIILKPR